MICIVPINDFKPHDDFNSMCECEPSLIMENEEMILVHNSYDGREYVEQANEIINYDRKHQN